MIECLIKDLPKCDCCHRRLDCIASGKKCVYGDNVVLGADSFISENCMKECPKKLFQMKRRWANG